jgi:hypothetical protein
VLLPRATAETAAPWLEPVLLLRAAAETVAPWLAGRPLPLPCGCAIAEEPADMARANAADAITILLRVMFYSSCSDYYQLSLILESDVERMVIVQYCIGTQRRQS